MKGMCQNNKILSRYLRVTDSKKHALIFQDVEIQGRYYKILFVRDKDTVYVNLELKKVSFLA